MSSTDDESDHSKPERRRVLAKRDFGFNGNRDMDSSVDSTPAKKRKVWMAEVYLSVVFIHDIIGLDLLI